MRNITLGEMKKVDLVKKIEISDSTIAKMTKGAEHADGNEQKEEFLECEMPWVYRLLIFVGGWFGAYTFLLRGGVFCNAQTANVVLLGLAIGNGQWRDAAYLLLPIGAYFLGAFLSEYLGKEVKKFHLLRWDTIFIGLEIMVVVGLGFLPAKAPNQIAQVSLNFICSMQFNTFRQVRGVAASTTFVTNHIRQVGYYAAKYAHHRTKEFADRIGLHGRLIIFFLMGAITGTVAAQFFKYHSIWGSAVVLMVIFARLSHADLSYEKNVLSKVPHGH